MKSPKSAGPHSSPGERASSSLDLHWPGAAGAVAAAGYGTSAAWGVEATARRSRGGDGGGRLGRGSVGRRTPFVA